jgi:NAD(P)-dependent dehydrogenase (short-subunit alcohol dehydrogenase family)
MSKALITGGGGVLGSSMARALLEKGIDVAIADLRIESAEKVVSENQGLAGKPFAVEMNVLDKESLQRSFQIIKEWCGGTLDILINGAGGNHPKGTTTKTTYSPGDEHLDDIVSFFDLDSEGIRFVFDLNFLGTLLPTQYFTPLLLQSDNPNVINISSMNAFTPLTKIPAYSAAKAAVSNLTQWLAVHFASTGLRVNAIAPGFFLTDQNRSLLTTDSGELTDRGKIIINRTPMGRFGDPGDLNSTLLWLCDPSSSFITGITVPIDGGFNAFTGV